MLIIYTLYLLLIHNLRKVLLLSTPFKFVYIHQIYTLYKYIDPLTCMKLENNKTWIPHII